MGDFGPGYPIHGSRGSDATCRDSADLADTTADVVAASHGAGSSGHGAAERWLPVVGWERVYQVSDLGRLRRVRYCGGYEPGHVKAWGTFGKRGPDGEKPYLGTTLSGNGRREFRAAHDLVAAAFLGQRPDGYQVDHLNGDGKDNRAANLEYVTAAVNKQRAMRDRGYRCRVCRVEGHNVRTCEIGGAA